MVTDLFGSGKIFLIRKPVSGRFGIPRLMGCLCGGSLGISDLDPSEEIYVVFTTKNQDMLCIFHSDAAGVDLTKRKLVGKKFRRILLDNAMPLRLTREKLKKLILEGTCEDVEENQPVSRMIKSPSSATKKHSRAWI